MIWRRPIGRPAAAGDRSWLLRRLVPCIARMRRACGILVAFATLISAQQSSVVVDVSPVVHVDAPFSALLRLPPSSALKKGGIEAKASLVDAKGGETELAKLKLTVSTGGEVLLEHELEGLVVRYDMYVRQSTDTCVPALPFVAVGTSPDPG